MPVVSVFVVVVVCLKWLISLEPKVAGKSFISMILLICEEVNASGIFLKSTFPVVLVVVVVVVCLKLLIWFDPNVSGKSFISIIFLISEEVKASGISLKFTLPVVLVVVVVVVCLKLLISFEPNVGGKSFILIIFSTFILFLIICSGLISSEVAFVKYLLSICSSVISSVLATGLICLKYLFISSVSVIGVTEATFASSSFWLWFCSCIFCIWFKSTFTGLDIFVFDKFVGIWKYLFKSSPSSASCTWILEVILGTCWIFSVLLFVAGVWTICWVLMTCEITFVGASLFWEVKVAISTAPWFESPNCWMSNSFGSFDCLIEICAWFWFSKFSSFLSLSISFWLYSFISSLFESGLAFILIWFLYIANSSGEYWFTFWASFCSCWFWISISGECISSWLYLTGLEEFIATS